MIAAGIDIGSDYTQAAILEDEELVSYGETRTGFDLDEAGERAIADALDGARRRFPAAVRESGLAQLRGLVAALGD